MAGPRMPKSMEVKLPPVVDDVMTRAAPQVSTCPACLGVSTAGQGPCATCNSTGRVQTEPDLDRQKLALELGQLLEKKGGLIVQQNNATVASLGASQPGSLEQLQQAVGDLLFSGGRRGAEGDVVEAEHIRDEPPAEYPHVDEPELPFGDPRAPRRDEPPTRRRPDLPGEPEE